MALRQYLFSRILGAATRFHEPRVEGRKRSLLGLAAGRVLEIGPGVGQNFDYYGADVEWTGYEPNPYLAGKIDVRPGRNLIREEFAEERAESFDFAVSTLVLCSVREPGRVLRGLHRALKPGGRLLYLEHVAAARGTALRKAQERWRRVWGWCADGCDPARETSQAIVEAGFHIEEEEEFALPMWLAGPHVCGVARR